MSTFTTNKGGSLSRFLLCKRWRVAVAVIRTCRAMSKLATLPWTTMTHPYAVLDVRIDQQHFGFSAADLASLVRDKNPDHLTRRGGVRGVLAGLRTHIERGINGSDADVRARSDAFGRNALKKPPSKGFLRFALEAINDKILILLLACAIVSLAFGVKQHGLREGWYDGGSILVAVFLVVAVTAVSNFRQSKQFERLSEKYNDVSVDVMRGGRRREVSVFDLVVGDVVWLKIGDQVPADGLFLEGYALKVDESSMTGESDHVDIDGEGMPFLMSGAKVVDGYGKMVVTAVGSNTTWGEMMGSLAGLGSAGEKTPLQERLEGLTSAIQKVGLSVAAVVLVVLMIRYFTGNTQDDDGNQEFHGSKTSTNQIINSMVKIFSAAVTIIVVAIPEGLPLAVTLTLAYSMKRMMADQAMVRKLSACETMGSATTICTDKTGTLTMNQMTVVQFIIGDESPNTSLGVPRNVVELLRSGVVLNTTGTVYKADPLAEPEISGSPTEKAILSWAVKDLGIDMEEIKSSCALVHVEAFNSEKKRSGVLVKDNTTNMMDVHWKGAAEIVLAACSHCFDCEGMKKSMDRDRRSKFEEIIEGMAQDSLRCIAFAQRRVSDEDTEFDEGGRVRKIRDEDLTLLGIVGLKDPCRPGVRKAVQDCKEAGVDVKMVTGDNVFTARAIAFECGILDQKHSSGVAVIEGKDFRNYTLEERMEVVDEIRVMARSSPLDKLLMVQCLKQKGDVVAVTGDGTNDAPALKEADIGLSMGIQGTEVAKESSDIVILDDNFTSVVTVLQWGRCVYTNIQKFIQFQLTVNVSALTINVIAAISSGEVPLTPVQMLWVNLIMDTLGALALATEKPTRDLMKKPPVGRTEPLVTNIMYRNLVPQALYQIAVLLALQFKGSSIFGVDDRVKKTLIFNAFVLCQVFNEFNSRKLEKKNVFEGIHKNRLFIAIIGITIVLQVVMVEFLRRFADTERLNWVQWAACIGIGMVSWPIGWIAKCVPVADGPLFGLLKHH
ncbi:putative calcium-transporting ATPase 13, plasma membrane-type [Acorus gramineus]|uniref:Calcium-transporting ATPase n=1 Tax=Acorus gramineus TaxID=55184 RepID=A0AAV9BBP0_ACOGR|nr:putative calcium-transporting ATPase 13, plasma membrane-type [Acorus gramineus]